jgi:hypothetical protein
VAGISRFALLLAIASALFPAAAAAGTREADVLLDLAPTGTRFKDRVFAPGAARIAVARAAQSVQFTPYAVKEGYSVPVALSPQYSSNAQVARSYVEFLDSLPHGRELMNLYVYIAPPAEVAQTCGGPDGTLACYDGRSHVMVVPGEQMDSGTGVTTSYVVTHEYGHHIAAFRSNAPFSAFATGPKYWSSYELVCIQAQTGRLFPGNEAENYLSNPGEGWAEAYAHINYRDQEWIFTPLLKPDEGAFAAAAKDIGLPWTGPRTRAFRGRFGKGGPRSRSFSVDLKLDGAFSAQLKGPRGTNYNMKISSLGRERGRTKAAGSSDRLGFAAACREQPTERVTLTVTRARGAGRFTLRVRYAG